MECDIHGCENPACYSSSQWLKSGGMIVLYFCEAHAIQNSEYFDDYVDIGDEDDNNL